MENNAGSLFANNLELRRKVDLILRTGQLLMENGADTNRIDITMKRVAAHMNIPVEKLHIDIRWTMLLVNVSDKEHSISKFQKCQKHVINMTTISLVSDLSWHAIERDYTLEEYEHELESIAAKPRAYREMLVAVGAGFACGGFCKLFGCDWTAFLMASVCAFCGFCVRTYCVKGGINLYFSLLIAAFISTCLAFATSLTGLSATPYHPLLACALFIVPGVPMINFVDDMIDNHLLVGITRASNTAMMIGAMTFGITFALRTIVLLFDSEISISQTFSELSMVPNDSYWVYALAAAIAAVGFSMIFNIPKRLLWVIALGGVISVCTRNFVNFDLGFGGIVGSFIGSLVASLLAVQAAKKLHVPIHVLAIPSVIPMIPGVLMYRSVLDFINMSDGVNNADRFFVNGINSGLIVLCISLGVAIPNIVARGQVAIFNQQLLKHMLGERDKRAGNSVRPRH